MARSARTVERVTALQSPCKSSPPCSSHASSWEARGVLPLPRRPRPGGADASSRHRPRLRAARTRLLSLGSRHSYTRTTTALTSPASPPLPRLIAPGPAQLSAATTSTSTSLEHSRRRDISLFKKNAAARKLSFGPGLDLIPLLLLRPLPSPATRLAAPFSLRAVAPSRRLRPTSCGPRRLTSVALVSSRAKERASHLQSSRCLSRAASSLET